MRLYSKLILLLIIKRHLESLTLFKSASTDWRQPLKASIRILLLLVAMAVGVSSCGYRNPYVYSGPTKTIYITNWKNRTSKLNLNSDIYKSLLKWYQKSGSFKVSKQKSGADFILAGEIVSINLPSLTYNTASDSSAVEVKLTIRYILKDLKQNQVMFEQSKATLSEDYTVSADTAVTADNEQDALEEIIDNMSETIYLKTLKKLSKM